MAANGRMAVKKQFLFADMHSLDLRWPRASNATTNKHQMPAQKEGEPKTTETRELETK